MNSVFIPPGRNPFQLPPLPQSYYLPSPSKDIQDKNITLTPQKVVRRHEYSLPPEVYTPEQYSIHEEESTSTKPPIPSRDKDLVTKDLERYLNDVESWTSSKFVEQWPSKNSGLNEEISALQLSSTSTMPSKSGPFTSTARTTKEKSTFGNQGKPLRVKTSFATDRDISVNSKRSSDIEMRLNRFRYGNPKPPSERKKEKSRLPTPSLTSSRAKQPSATPRSNPPRPPSTSMHLEDIQKDSALKDVSRFSKISKISAGTGRRYTSPRQSKTTPKPVDTESPDQPDSPEAVNTSISTLNTRLEKLLQESSSVISSPLPQSTLKSTTDKSSSFDMKVSSYDATKSTEESGSTGHLLANFPRNDSKRFDDVEIPRKMQWQKENIAPRAKLQFSPTKSCHEDDILFQWRLKRKMENARDNVAKNQGSPVRRTSPPRRQFYKNEAEKPYLTQFSNIYQHKPSVYGGYQNPTTSHHDCTTPHQHQPACNCQYGPPICAMKSTRVAMDQNRIQDHNLDSNPRQSDPLIKSRDVDSSPMISAKTQTTKSLILSDDETVSMGSGKDKQKKDTVKRSASLSSFPHTSTPASSVSFHRVRIIEADAENSPQTSKGSPQARVFSPVSCRTEATTVWSSTAEQTIKKNGEDVKSPMSSVKTSDPRFTSDTESCSPTANVVREVIGSRLFNTSQTPSSSSSRIEKLKEKKKNKLAKENEQLDGSYRETQTEDEESVSPAVMSEGSESPVESETTSHDQSTIASRSQNEPEIDKPDVQDKIELTPPVSDGKVDRVKEPETGVKEENNVNDFDPGRMFDQLLEDIANDPGDFEDDPVLMTLCNQRDQFMLEFRNIEAEIERATSANQIATKENITVCL